MSHGLLTIKVVRFLSVLAILAGLMFLSWKVTTEYFQYKTATRISIQDYPDEVVAPAVVFCVRFDVDPTVEHRVGRFFTDDYFNDGNDTWRILKLWSQIYPPGRKLEYVTRKYFMGNRYCISVRVLEQFEIEEVTSPKIPSLPNFYQFVVTTEPLHSKFAFFSLEKRCNPKTVYFRVIGDHSTVANPRNKYDDIQLCSTAVASYETHLSYSSSILVRLPPPYDTNCLDYRKTSGHSISRHDCYDECLKEQTLASNLVPGIIDRKRYLRSKMTIAPPNIIEDRDKINFLITNKSLPQDVLQSYRTVNERWQAIKKFCKISCQLRDCFSERITSDVATNVAGLEQLNDTLMSKVTVILRTSNQPILHVTFVPRQILIDYIVYMCSNLSFWLGFCPLTVLHNIDERLRQWLESHCKGNGRRGKIPKRQARKKWISLLPTRRPIDSVVNRITNRICSRKPKRKHIVGGRFSQSTSAPYRPLTSIISLINMLEQRVKRVEDLQVIRNRERVSDNERNHLHPRSLFVRREEINAVDELRRDPGIHHAD